MKKSILVSFLIWFYFSNILCQISKDVFPSGTYKPFDLEGGYYPGSFVTKKKESVQPPIVGRERLVRSVCMKDLLKYSISQGIPTRILDRKKSFQASLDVEAKYAGIDPSVKSNLKNVKDISLKVNKGQRYYIDGFAIQDVIYALPLQDLQQIKFEMDKNRNIYFISEVVQFDDAELIFKWDKAIGVGLKAKIPQSLGLGIENQWTDDATLTVKFSPGQLVSYKDIEITKDYKKLIDERINFRKTNGDEKCPPPPPPPVVRDTPDLKKRKVDINTTKFTDETGNGKGGTFPYERITHCGYIRFFIEDKKRIMCEYDILWEGQDVTKSGRKSREVAHDKFEVYSAKENEYISGLTDRYGKVKQGKNGPEIRYSLGDCEKYEPKLENSKMPNNNNCKPLTIDNIDKNLAEIIFCKIGNRVKRDGKLIDLDSGYYSIKFL